MRRVIAGLNGGGLLILGLGLGLARITGLDRLLVLRLGVALLLRRIATLLWITLLGSVTTLRLLWITLLLGIATALRRITTLLGLLLTRRLELQREEGVATVLGIGPPRGNGPFLPVNNAAAFEMRTLVVGVLWVLVVVVEDGTREIFHLKCHI